MQNQNHSGNNDYDREFLDLIQNVKEIWESVQEPIYGEDFDVRLLDHKEDKEDFFFQEDNSPTLVQEFRDAIKELEDIPLSSDLISKELNEYHYQPQEVNSSFESTNLSDIEGVLYSPVDTQGSEYDFNNKVDSLEDFEYPKFEFNKESDFVSDYEPLSNPGKDLFSFDDNSDATKSDTNDFYINELEKIVGTPLETTLPTSIFESKEMEQMSATPVTPSQTDDSAELIQAITDLTKAIDQLIETTGSSQQSTVGVNYIKSIKE